MQSSKEGKASIFPSCLTDENCAIFKKYDFFKPKKLTGSSVVHFKDRHQSSSNYKSQCFVVAALSEAKTRLSKEAFSNFEVVLTAFPEELFSPK